MVEESFSIIQACIRCGRKLKNDARISLKGNEVRFCFQIPFNLLFEMRGEDNREIVRKMLRASVCDITESRRDFNEAYPEFAGTSQVGNVTGTMYTAAPLWN